MASNSSSSRVGSAGRFGARYGRVVRRRVAQIESDTNDDHDCPECDSDAVSRAGTGIWECDSCGYAFAGGCFRPETAGGRGVERSINTALSDEEGVDT